MSIEKNRLLMESQVKKLKGQLNESIITGDEMHKKVFGSIYDKMVDDLQKKYVKTISAKVKKALIGKVVEYENSSERTDAAIKSVDKIWTKPYYENSVYLNIDVTLEDGSTEELDYRIY